MEKVAPPWTLKTLAELMGGEIDGPEDLVIQRPVLVGSDDPEGITFAVSRAYLEKVEASGVGAVILQDQMFASSKPSIRVPDAKRAFGILLHFCVRPIPLASGIHPTALIDPSASIDSSASIGPYTVVERGAWVGPNAKVHAQCYVGENCKIGAGSELRPQVVLIQDVSIGENTLIHSGCVIGADGFGFVWDGTQRIKVPHSGGVSLGSDVELGSNCAVDRSMAGNTEIGDGTKIDNLVQVAHNVKIGKNGAIAAQSGIAGTCKVGDNVVMGGAVGLRDHVSIGDNISLGGRSAVDTDLTEPGEYLGIPARPIREAAKAMILSLKLPEMHSRIRDLERTVRALQAQLEEKGTD